MSSPIQELISTTTKTSHRSSPEEPSVKSEMEDIKNIEPESKRKDSKETQVQKPMYDGYIIAPDVFQNMVNEERRDSVTSARAHYEATSYLRRNSEVTKIKRDIYTMTDTLGSAEPIAPDIFFKLKFDSGRKDRTKGEDDDSFIKDYVNVADLEGPAVDEILRMIEHEQDKRAGSLVPITQKKKLENKSMLNDLPKESLETFKVDKVICFKLLIFLSIKVIDFIFLGWR